MKYWWVITAVILMMILASASPIGLVGHNRKYSGNRGDENETAPNFLENDGFTPENISLEDDAFHSDIPLHAETWYFECMNGNYSIVFITTVLSSDGHTGAAMAGLYIYRDGRMAVMERIPSFSFSASNDMPLVQISGIAAISGFMEKGHIIYNISFEMNGNRISLRFVNYTEGWQGDMSMGWWLAVPGFYVSGTMEIDGNFIDIEGKGYHDHNAFSISTPAAERGYMDGKILGDNISVVWGYIMHNVRDVDEFAILSENGKYIAISPETMKIKFSSYIYDHGIVPTGVFISINDSRNGVFAELNITALNFHHIHLPFLRYWRYHVRVEGKIITPSRKEKIDKTDIMERMIY